MTYSQPEAIDAEVVKLLADLMLQSVYLTVTLNQPETPPRQIVAYIEGALEVAKSRLIVSRVALSAGVN